MTSTTYKKDMVSVGETYGKLTVIGPLRLARRPSPSSSRINYYYTVRCRCECGNEHDYFTYALIRGKKQCGTCGNSKRTTYFVTFGDQRMSLRKACKTAGIRYHTVFARMHYKGFNVQEAFNYHLERKNLDLRYAEPTPVGAQP